MLDLVRRPDWLISSALGAIALILGFAGNASTQEKEIRYSDNLFLDAGGGFEQDPLADDTQGFGQVGFNWGAPLTKPSGSAVLGLQLGADVKLSEEHPAWNATAGLFSRDLPSFGSDQAAGALLVDYQHTFAGNDLIALRPIVGSTVGDLGSLGGTASIGIKDDETDGGNVTEEESIDRFGGFWNRQLNEWLTSELLVGYQLGDVDSLYFQPQLVFAINEHTDFGLGAHINTDGDYATTFGLSYHFGGTSRHEWIHNVGGSGTTLYTPFPKQPLGNFLRETRRVGEGGGTGIIGGDGPGIAGAKADDGNDGNGNGAGEAGGAGGAGGSGAVAPSEPGGPGAGGAGGTGAGASSGGGGGAGGPGGSGGTGGAGGGSGGSGGGSGCNRGPGNGAEGCDPGNSGGNPGNAGEGNEGAAPGGSGGGGCNRGSGNDAEGCDPGNSGGNPGNAGEDNEVGSGTRSLSASAEGQGEGGVLRFIFAP